MSARIVYVCDWCGFEESPRGNTSQPPAGWARPYQVAGNETLGSGTPSNRVAPPLGISICGACRQAEKKALNDVQAMRTSLRKPPMLQEEPPGGDDEPLV